ncbi:diphthine methyl ester synthase-like [Oppia nitens]|uniref:diphthine methyl ester synthase-like n=1 Tax=Oppia nitens TaxID=1686743 RepID=UPI0023DC31C0|nr:diphthine methyl ester synthase-like [Oppia nitens]
MLYLIGLGLGDAKDITVKGLEVVRSAKRVYLESYTSILSVSKEALEEFYGREVVVSDRLFVEQSADEILEDAVVNDIAFLVVGDPLGATTHTDLILRAHQKGVKHRLIHNASIINACGAAGLQLYNFGEIVSIPFWTDNWRPDSFMDKILSNLRSGLHTLCLLDIKVKEQSIEAMMKRKVVYEPPRYMSVTVAAKQLLDIIEMRPQFPTDLLNDTSVAIALARIGCDNQCIKTCKLKDMLSLDMGEPLHSVIIPGKLHPIETEMLRIFADNIDIEI